MRSDLICIYRMLDAAGNRNLIAKDTLVRAAGVGQKDGDDEGAEAGGWMLVGRVDWVHWVGLMGLTVFYNPKSEGEDLRIIVQILQKDNENYWILQYFAKPIGRNELPRCKQRGIKRKFLSPQGAGN